MARSREIGLGNSSTGDTSVFRQSGGTGIVGARGPFADVVRKLAKDLNEEIIPAVCREVAKRVFIEIINRSPEYPFAMYSQGTFIDAWEIKSGFGSGSAAGSKSPPKSRRTGGKNTGAKQRKIREIEAFFSSTSSRSFSMTNPLPYAGKVEFMPGWRGKRDNKGPYHGEAARHMHGPYAPVRATLTIIDKLVADAVRAVKGS